MLRRFYFLLSRGRIPPIPQINEINEPLLLHPANTNTLSSCWKTSFFWGQGQGSTSNLPQSGHMKHLDQGQGKQGRKELVGDGEGVGAREGAGSELVDDLPLGWKKASLSAVCSAALGSAPYTSSNG